MKFTKKTLTSREAAALPATEIEMAIPRHVVIIPDGNRRWAKRHGLPTFEGHRQGMNRIHELSKAARDMGIGTMTVWGFSTENWDREESEKEYLFKIFMSMLRRIAKEARKRNIRIRHLGRKDRLPSMLIDYLKKLESSTESNTQYQFNIALDYGGRDEIVRAMKRMIESGIASDKVDEALFSSYLDTHSLPDPDFIIRTSGEQRTSGLLPWQSAYAEYYFTSLYLPDFGVTEFNAAIEEFGRRQRRFGR